MKKLYKIHLSKSQFWAVAESEAEAVLMACKWYERYHKSIADETIKFIEVERSQKAVYGHLATLYAEDHGIIEYHTNKNTMVYYQTFPYEHATYRAVVNLDTMKETREQMKNYYKPYNSRIGGKYQANWC